MDGLKPLRALLAIVNPIGVIPLLHSTKFFAQAKRQRSIHLAALAAFIGCGQRAGSAEDHRVLVGDSDARCVGALTSDLTRTPAQRQGSYQYSRTNERKSRGWPLTDLAKVSGVSRGMLFKLEHGESSPTANLLGKLSGAFGMSISTLIARAETVHGRLLRKAEQPQWVDPATGYVRRHVSPRSDLPLDLVSITLPGGNEVPYPASAYAFLRQLVWVLQGDLIFVEASKRHSMHEGDCIELGPPTDCIFRNETATPCVYAVAVLSSR